MVIRTPGPGNKLTQEDRTRIINWIRERAGTLYGQNRTGTAGDMAKAVDTALTEFAAGQGPRI